jgi:hypothetical protein
MAGEISEDLEAMFRGGAGRLPQKLKEHLEKGA